MYFMLKTNNKMNKYKTFPNARQYYRSIWRVSAFDSGNEKYRRQINSVQLANIQRRVRV